MSNGEGQPKPDFELIRLCKEPEGAFGCLLQDRLPFAVTLERTYELPGRDQHVKIPPGSWVCRSTFYHKGGYDTFEVTDVPDHSRLLFHKGNVEDDAEGCILVGRRFGLLEGRPAILESRDGFLEFMRRTGGRPMLRLLIREAL